VRQRSAGRSSSLSDAGRTNDDQTWHILWCRSRTDDKRILLRPSYDSPGYYKQTDRLIGRQTERLTQTDRLTHRRTDWYTNKHTDREIEYGCIRIMIHRDTIDDRQTDRDRQTDWHTNKPTDRKTGRRTSLHPSYDSPWYYRQIQIQTERHTGRQTDRQRAIGEGITQHNQSSDSAKF